MKKAIFSSLVVKAISIFYTTVDMILKASGGDDG